MDGTDRALVRARQERTGNGQDDPRPSPRGASSAPRLLLSVRPARVHPHHYGRGVVP